MNKKIVLTLLCISNVSVGMNQGLPKDFVEIPQLISGSVRVRTKASHLAYYARNFVVPKLLGFIITNDEDSLKVALKDVMDWYPDLLRQSYSKDLLHKAISLSNDNCVELLLQYNANPNALIDQGNRPLHLVKGSKMVQLLISYGALIDQKNERGETPFFNKIKEFCLETAQALYVAGEDVNAYDNKKNSPLHYAVMHLGNKEIKFLLYHGACFDEVNNQGETAYQLADRRQGEAIKAFEEYAKVVSAINATVKESTSLTIKKLLAYDGEQLKKLFILDSSGYCSRDIAIAEKLFQHCDDTIWDELALDISSYSPETLSLVRFVKGRSNYKKCFLNSLQNNEFLTANQLLKANPYLLYTYKDEYQSDVANDLFVEKLVSTPVSCSEYEYLKEMIHNGFDIDSYNALGSPVLSAVIQKPGCDNTYIDILRASTQINVKDSSGNAPLFYAAGLDNKDMVLRLLSYGAVVNKDLCEYSLFSDPMRIRMKNVYKEQQCMVCATHDYDLSNIPCENRHLGYFMCTQCYDQNSQKTCPLCCGAMGDFGS